jgi:acetylornithine/N-succinyldiaminopimelate aminotransferase
MSRADGNLSNLLGPGTHGTTYGGSPLACAVGIATLRTILDENLCASNANDAVRPRRIHRAWLESSAVERDSPARPLHRLRTRSRSHRCEVAATRFHLPAQKLLDAGMMVTPAGPERRPLALASQYHASHADEGLRIFKVRRAGRSSLTCPCS